MKDIINAVVANANIVFVALGVVSFAINQFSQVFAWSKESKMGKIEQLIENAISCVYLLKGQALKKETGKLELEQGQKLAADALARLKDTAGKRDIDLDKELGDDDSKRAKIQNVFDRMRARLKSQRSMSDVSEMVAE